MRNKINLLKIKYFIYISKYNILYKYIIYFIYINIKKIFLKEEIIFNYNIFMFNICIFMENINFLKNQFFIIIIVGLFFISNFQFNFNF